MGGPGMPTTAGPGATRDKIIFTKLDLVGQSTMRCRALIQGEWTDRYWAPFVNGVYAGRNDRSDFGELFEKVYPVDPFSTTASMFLEDAGDWPQFENGYVPSEYAENLDALTAQRIQIQFPGNSYTLTSVRGDAQLSAISITGAVRGKNVGQTVMATRGRLHYQILTANNVSTVTSASWLANVATLVFASHNFIVGEVVTVAGITPAGFNGSVTITAITATSISYSLIGDPGAWVLGGTASDKTTKIIRWWNSNILVAEGSGLTGAPITCTPINDSGLTVTCTLTYTADVLPAVAFLEVRWPASYQIHYSTSPLVFPRTPEATQTDLGKATYAYLSAPQTNGVYNFNVLPVDDDGDVQSSTFWSTGTVTVNTVPTGPIITSVTGTAAAATVHWSLGTSGSTYAVYYGPVGYPANLGGYATPAPIVTGIDATAQLLAAITGYPGKVAIIVRATKGGNQEQTDSVFMVEFDSSGALVQPKPNRASIQSMSIASGRALTVEGMVNAIDAVATADTLDLWVQAAADAAVSAASWVGNVATITCGAHAFIVGQTVNITGISPTGYNGFALITAVTATTISFALTANPGAYVSGGTVAFIGLSTTGTPQATVALPAALNAIQRASATYTPASNGWYHVAVTGEVSGTGARSRIYSEYLVYLDATAPPKLITIPTAKVIRGK